MKLDSINDINAQLRKSAKKDSADFVNTFLKNEDAVIDLLKNFNGVKSEIYLQNLDNRLSQLLSFSSIFSDITLLNTAPSAVTESHMIFFEPEHEFFRDRELTIPQAYLHETGLDPRRFFPCYSYRNTHDVKELFAKYRPLIKSNRLLVRPLRSLYVSRGENDSLFYYVNPNTENSHWYIDDRRQYDFVTIDNGIEFESLNTLFEITLPFINGIDLEKLDSILTDETDLIGSFRSELKKTVTSLKLSGKTDFEFVQDVLRPEIEKIERKFKKIKNSHRLGVGVTVGSFSLTLVLTTLAGANILESLSAGIPTVASGLILAESNYRDKMSDIKENPYYLLWQIKRTK